ncbi:membrane protein [Devosia pacifica]|uniref:Membrane protein n=1 Tax=Devosia pacifica TaxID=1335967 RepID=A0A918SA23_9HYPH|nr:hypothetical protein [Devosia pacifica]GHA29450.1 membrane protein [Devosia pacifica]
MKRFLLWLLGGLMLGGIIHILIVLNLPALAEQTSWRRLAQIDADNRLVVLEAPETGTANPLGLDPALLYGICRVDLSQGPAYMSGTLPDAFWSLAIYDREGIVTYATTNRDGIGRTLDVGVFNAAQTRQLAQQELDVEEGLLIVESSANELYMLVRLAPYDEAVRPRFREALSQINCGVSTED